MTEAEWMASDDPVRLVGFLQGKASNRKLRLCFCAACRSVWAFADRSLLRRAVEAGELLADGLLTPDDVADLRREICPGPFYWGDKPNATAWGAVVEGLPLWTISSATDLHLAFAVKTARERGLRTLPPGARETSGRGLAELVRDIFGNPFRPVTLNPSWFTSTAVTLARGIYDDRAFDRLPILADALQDAGCDNAAVLDHCRGPGPHVRGCWVVDLLLGKE